MIKTEKLKSEIDKSGLRFSWIAKQLTLSPYGFRKKVNGDNEFKVSEVNNLCKILNLSDEKRNDIFFLSSLDT